MVCTTMNTRSLPMIELWWTTVRVHFCATENWKFAITFEIQTYCPSTGDSLTTIAASNVNTNDISTMIVAMIRVSANMFFSCLNGPIRKQVLFEKYTKKLIKEVFFCCNSIRRLFLSPKHRNDISECVEQCESGETKMEEQTEWSQQWENYSDDKTNAETFDACRPIECWSIVDLKEEKNNKNRRKAINLLRKEDNNFLWRSTVHFFLSNHIDATRTFWIILLFSSWFGESFPLSTRFSLSISILNTRNFD